MNAVDLKAYDRVLNDYHVELMNVVFLSAHLLDRGIDQPDQPDWYKSACHMMRDRLVELAEALPFPGMTQGSDATARSEARTDAPHTFIVPALVSE